MPFTYMGFNIAASAIFNLKTDILQWCVYLVYMGHYCTIDLFTTIIVSVIYYYSIKCGLYLTSIMKSNKTGELRCRLIIVGLLISVVALFIQEFLGHYMGGDDASRPEGVFNAILYAKFYSIGHYFIDLQ